MPSGYDKVSISLLAGLAVGVLNCTLPYWLCPARAEAAAGAYPSQAAEPEAQLDNAVAAGSAQPGSQAQATPSRRLEPNEARESALLRIAGQGFRIHRTPSFVVAHNTPPGMVENLSLRLEQTYASVRRFCERSGFPAKPLEQRLEVIFFDTAEQYAAYSRPFGFDSNGTYGFYNERTNRSAFYNVHNDPQLQELYASIQSARDSADQIEQMLKAIRGNTVDVELTYGDGRRARLSRTQAKNEVANIRRKIKSLDLQQQAYCDRINRTVVQHEVAHQVLFNTGLHARFASNPKWLLEGLACMFETPPGAGGGGIGAVNQARLKDFRQAVVGNTGRKYLNAALHAEAVDDGRITSFADLIRYNTLFEERGDQGAVHYAAAWALLHYLHRTQNKSLPGYMQEIAGRRRGTVLTPDEELALFERHFGPVDAAFAARVSGFILALPYRPLPGDF